MAIKPTPSEQQEEAFTRKRVMFNNNWAKSQWKEIAQKEFEDRLNKLQKQQIFGSVRLHVDNATEILFEDAQLNKLHSIITDIYEALPMHPDSAFDQAWSAFEIALHLYNKRVWQGKNSKTDDLIRLLCTQEIPALFKVYPTLKDSLFNLFDIMPLSIGRFVFVRWFRHRGLELQSHYGEIRRRTAEIITEDLYERLKTKYNESDDATFEYESAQELRDFLRGHEYKFKDKVFPALGEYERLRLVVSSLLYTARNERFHGDNFSHFKSDKASLKTYQHFYYLLIFTYSMLWVVLLRLGQCKGDFRFVTEDRVSACIDRNVELLRTAFKQD